MKGSRQEEIEKGERKGESIVGNNCEQDVDGLRHSLLCVRVCV